ASRQVRLVAGVHDAALDQIIIEAIRVTPTTDTNGLGHRCTAAHIWSASSQASDTAGQLDWALQASAHITGLWREPSASRLQMNLPPASSIMYTSPGCASYGAQSARHRA